MAAGRGTSPPAGALYNISHHIISSLPASPPSSNILKRKAERGDSVRSKGSFEADHAWNVRWLKEARRVLKPGGSLWVTGTHHIIFSLGFALQSLGFRVINTLV
jgi:DNA modification methylase